VERANRLRLRVQDYLGYKSTEEPLFKQADNKLMPKAVPLVDPDRFEKYSNEVENYREKADQGYMLAYTHSWGWDSQWWEGYD